MSMMSSNITVHPPPLPIFDQCGLKKYKKTRKELAIHPPAEEIKRCDTPEAIFAVLQGKVNKAQKW